MRCVAFSGPVSRFLIVLKITVLGYERRSIKLKLAGIVGKRVPTNSS